jgi:hypothetical protein
VTCIDWLHSFRAHGGIWCNSHRALRIPVGARVKARRIGTASCGPLRHVRPLEIVVGNTTCDSDVAWYGSQSELLEHI